MPKRPFGHGNGENAVSRPAAVPDGARSAGLVEFRDVCKTYDGESLAVAHLNLIIGAGEFVTFLGPSGSGKTTSLMMVAGFEVPTSGDILISGRSMARVAPHKRNIGMVFQNYALFPHMTVAENIAFPLSVRGVPRAETERKVKLALELVRLEKFAGRKPAELSGGQQQRVALARALVFDPVLVLMDEPLGALDKQLREQLQSEIKHIHARVGVTVVYVTHDQSEALTMSDRIAVFNEGAIQQVATPMDLYRYPRTAFVANFVGENNQFKCTVVAVEDSYCSLAMEDGSLFRAGAVDTLTVGSTCLASIRPEHVLINPDEDGAVTTAVLEEVIYHGDHVRVRLRTAAGDLITSKVMHPEGIKIIPQGQSVPVGWRAEDCRAFASLTQ